MHDCRKIEESLVDMVFGELVEDERTRILVEVEGCALCRSQLQSIRATLAGFDRAAGLMQPDEDYWQSYEARLRAKIFADEQPGLWQRIVYQIRSFAPQPARAVSFAALLIVALVVWMWFNQSSPTPGNHSQQQAEAGKEKAPPHEDRQAGKDELPAGGPQKEVAGHGGTNNLVVNPRGPKRPFKPTAEQPVVAQREAQPPDLGEPTTTDISVLVTNVMPNATIAAIISEETLQHFEKSQLLLRSFRNLDLAGKESAAALADERQRSRSLLFQNILLRREAEMTGNLPVEKVLNDLEPLLLDIANLEEGAAAADVRAIRERIRRKGIVASLQAYSARIAVASARAD
jgi:hypothetical protein